MGPGQRSPVKIRCIIVDDEPLARERIRQLLADEPDIAIVAECSDGFDALRILAGQRVDAMFLDIQMPTMDGFALLDALQPESTPAVVFITAYDEFAVKAFEVHAIDYVLKPIDRVRFAQAVERMRSDHANRGTTSLNRNLLSLVKDLRAERRHQDRLVISHAGSFRFLDVADVDYFTTEGNYVKVHVGKETHLLRSSMAGLEERLDPASFVRIHRSTLVNVRRLKELQPYRRDDALALLKDGTRLTVSRRYRSRLLATVTPR